MLATFVGTFLIRLKIHLPRKRWSVSVCSRRVLPRRSLGKMFRSGESEKWGPRESGIAQSRVVSKLMHPCIRRHHYSCDDHSVSSLVSLKHDNPPNDFILFVPVSWVAHANWRWHSRKKNERDVATTGTVSSHYGNNNGRTFPEKSNFPS